MESIKTQAKQRGYNQVQWQTPDFNADAIPFYPQLEAKAKTKPRFSWNLNDGDDRR